MPLNNPDYNESPSTSHLTTTSSTQNEQFCLRWNGYHSNLSTTFEQLFHNESLVDVTLVSEGRLLKAHKIVLAANSPYFQTIFSDTPCKHPIVIIKDVKWEELSALVEFMYRGEIHVAQEKIPSLLNLAEMFQICGLTDVHHEAEKKSVTEKDAQPETACGAVEPNHSKNDDVEVSPPKRMMKERDISRKQTFEPLDLPVEWPLEDEIKIEEQPLFKSARKRKQPPGADVVAEHSSADQHLNIPMTITHPTDVIPKSPTLIQPMQTRLLLEEADSFVEQTAEESDVFLNASSERNSPNETRAKQRVPAWSWHQLREAVVAVVTQRLRFTQASAQYNIPKGTLYDNVLGKTHRMAVLEELLLSPAEEAAVLEFCCDTSTSPFSKKTKKPLKDILDFLAQFDAYRAQAERFRFGDKPGFRWWWAFCRKHSIVSLYYEGIKLDEEPKAGGKRDRRSDDFDGGETV